MQRLLITFLIWLILSPTWAWAAVAFDAITNTNSTGFTSTAFTFSHTTSGSDRGLIVCVANDNTIDQTFTATYNGVSMTQVSTQVYGASVPPRVTVFRLENPATGTNDVVLTPSDNTTFGVAAISFTGVHQTTMTDTAVTATGSTTPITVDVTGSSDGMVIDCAATDITGLVAVATVGAGQTSRFNPATSSSYVNAYGSTETGAGAVTMSWAIDQNVPWTTIGVNIVAASGAADPTFGFLRRRAP